MPKERHLELASKGGHKTAENNRRRKMMREHLQAALDTIMKSPEGKVVKNPDTGEPMTRQEVAMLQLALMATTGNIASIQTAAKLMGEWIDKGEVSGTLTLSADVQMRQADPYTYLYRPFSETYQRFFYDNRDSRHVLLQGGRRSGKTQATIRHLLRLCAAIGGDLKVLVVCFQHPQLLKTIEDFTMITGITVHADEARTEGALWQFCNFDDFTKAQGSQCDYLFINEALNLPEEIGDTLVQGVRRQTFYNYNPTRSAWVQKYVADDGHNLIKTTFKDNAYLPAAQVAEFEALRERAMRPTATMHDKYMYQVFYLGDFATMVGQVFQRIETIGAEAYTQIDAEECYGLDFGFATDGDPTVLVGVRIANNKVYVRQYIYEQGLTSDEVLAKRMQQAGLNQYSEIRADYGGMGKGRISNLRDMSWSVMPCYKTTRLDGLSQLLCYDAIVIVEGGAETLAEFENLEIDEAKKTKGNDHAIDAVRYAFIAAKVYDK